jgi:hypothetical protein
MEMIGVMKTTTRKRTKTKHRRRYLLRLFLRWGNYPMIPVLKR